jgi:Flp pilus assembly protein TadD
MNGSFELHCEQARMLRQSGRLAEAVAAYDAALALRASSADAQFNRANALQALQRHDDAVAAYDRVLALAADDAQALNNRAVSLLALERAEEALASCDAALALRAHYAPALHNRCNALAALGRLQEALDSVDRALALHPGHAPALASRGRVLQRLGRHAEALDCFDAALRIWPDDEAALCDRGNALAALARHEEALASFARARALAPDDPELLWNEALARLAMGDYARGWPLYEARWRVPSLHLAPRTTDRPQWQGGDNIAGRTVLLHAEQGFGDAIQFVRYAREVAARGAEVVVGCAAPLQRLFARADGVGRAVVPGRDPLPPFDLHAPLMSLPLAFGTTLATIPSAPYLQADADRAAAWRQRLPTAQRNVGIVWSGNPDFRGAHLKTCAPALLAPLLATPGCRFVSLQLGAARAQLPALGDGVLDAADELADFDDTAALVEALDLVITIDTAVAHLAGALGKPVWILLPFAADWRWLVGRSDSPWYPTARLYRQPAPGAWQPAVAALLRDLQQWRNDGRG